MAFLAKTLHRHHGLTLQESKTEILTTERFSDRFGRSEKDEERGALVKSFAELVAQLTGLENSDEKESDDEDDSNDESQRAADGSLNLYGVIDYDDLDDRQKQIVDSLNLWQIIKRQVEGQGPLDVPLSRFVLRRIGQLTLFDEEDILLSNVSRLQLVFPEVIRAIATSLGKHPDKPNLGAKLLSLFDHPVVGHLEYHRAWILCVFARDEDLNGSDRLMELYQAFADELTRPGLVTALGKARVAHWFRSRKQDVMSMPPWERRAFLMAARCLPKDEVKHWYKSVRPQLSFLEDLVASWAQDQL